MYKCLFTVKKLINRPKLGYGYKPTRKYGGAEGAEEEIIETAKVTRPRGRPAKVDLGIPRKNEKKVRTRARK